ncbi:MAG: hypothetical protein ACF788_07845, partial [Novipirellula sp. JB048]
HVAAPQDVILHAGLEIGRASVEQVVDSFGERTSGRGSSDTSSVDQAFASLLEETFLEGGL